MMYWGINMYGVYGDKLKWKQDWTHASSDAKDLLLGVAASVKLPNGKTVRLSREFLNDRGEIYGIYAGYSWTKDIQGIDKSDVKDALWQVLHPCLDMAKEEFVKAVQEISDYNYG